MTNYERKRALLHYIKGQCELATLDDFSSSDDFPEVKENKDPEHIYIGEVLGINFEELFHNVEAKVISKRMHEANPELPWWFIGDNLTDITFNCVDNVNTFTNGIMDELDKKLKDMYELYLSYEHPAEEKVEVPANPEQILDYILSVESILTRIKLLLEDK